VSKSLVDRVKLAEASPIKSLAQLRLLVSQQVDLDHHLPAALEVLQSNPLIEAEYFPGDLLKAVLSIDPQYWGDHAGEWGEVHSILGRIESGLASVHDARATFLAMK
jgi:CDI immunity proteins